MSPSKKTLRERLLEEWQSFVIDVVQLFGFMLALKAGELLAKFLFGDALVFGIFPKGWLFDAGDIGLIFCFSWRACVRLLGRK